MSESEEMYLVTIARLKETLGDRPVPLSRLAEALGVQPVSANQMVRKLEEDGLLRYMPYRGVELSEAGARRALDILRQRRLWEVFLVEKLSLPGTEAEPIACQLEHAIHGEPAERLAAFLGYPAQTPSGRPIPNSQAFAVPQPGLPLARIGAGQCGQVTRVEAETAARAFLASSGIQPGAQLEVQAAREDGSLLVEVDGRQTVQLSARYAGLISIRVKEVECKLS